MIDNMTFDEITAYNNRKAQVAAYTEPKEGMRLTERPEHDDIAEAKANKLKKQVEEASVAERNREETYQRIQKLMVEKRRK